MIKSDRIWAATLGELQLQMTQATFDTWLRDSRLLKYEDGTFVIGVKSGYAKDWLESRLLPRSNARWPGRLAALPKSSLSSGPRNTNSLRSCLLRCWV